MTTTRRHFGTLAAAASLAAVAALPTLAHANDAASTAAIRQVLQQYEQALNKGDTAAIVRLYTDDGVQMAPDAPAAVGRDALKTAYDNTFKKIAVDLKFAVEDLKLLGNDAALLRTHSAGTLKLVGTDKPAGPAAFKELFVLRKQGDGPWRVSHYSFSGAPAKP